MNPGTAPPAWLSELRPDRAPPAPDWWPPAPGWWALAALLLVALAVAGFVAWRRRRTRLLRAALRELARLEAAADADGDGADDALAAGIEHLLRRYAIARYGRPAVAALTGPAWLDFAVRRGAADWAGATGRNLLAAAYGGAAPAERARWLAGARGFVGWREPRSAKKKP